MKRRNNRRRARDTYNGRAMVAIDISACRTLLDDGEIDGIDRLILLCAVASGDTPLSLAELRREVCGEALAAGGVEAAIKRRQIILR
jgi:hypothetical protein